MVYEDFTTFTEVDIAADRIQKTANHVDHYSKRNETTYLYKDYGAAHFGNFTHKIKVKQINNEAYNINVCWGLANALNHAHALETGGNTQIIIYLSEGSGSVLKVYLRESWSSSAYYDLNTGGFALGAWIYIKIVKSGTSINAYLYSDSSYSALVDTLTLTLHANHTLRYLYACNTWNTGATYYANTDIENFDLGVIFYIPFPNLSGRNGGIGISGQGGVSR